MDQSVTQLSQFTPHTISHPMSGADHSFVGAGARAEIEFLHWEAFVVKADVIRPTRRSVLYISQISVAINQYMTSTETCKLTLGESVTKKAEERVCVCVCVCVCVYLQSIEALCWATEKDVKPPCNSPSLGEGEMLEHSRYPQCTSLKTHTCTHLI